MSAVGKIVEPLSSEGTATPSRKPAGEPECGCECSDDESQLTQSSAIALLERELQGFGATRPAEYANSVGMRLYDK